MGFSGGGKHLREISFLPGYPVQLPGKFFLLCVATKKSCLQVELQPNSPLNVYFVDLYQKSTVLGVDTAVCPDSFQFRTWSTYSKISI